MVEETLRGLRWANIDHRLCVGWTQLFHAYTMHNVWTLPAMRYNVACSRCVAAMCNDPPALVKVCKRICPI